MFLEDLQLHRDIPAKGPFGNNAGIPLARAAAQVHLRFDTPVTRAYHRIAERRGKSKAKVAAARMLLLVCRSVLKNRRPYYNPVHGQAY